MAYRESEGTIEERKIIHDDLERRLRRLESASSALSVPNSAPGVSSSYQIYYADGDGQLVLLKPDGSQETFTKDP